MEAERVAPNGAAGSSVVRSIASSASSFGLSSEQGELDEKHRVLDDAYANQDFRALVRFARDLVRVETVGAVLTRVLDVAFATLAIHRGAILLRRPTGELLCEVARLRDSVEQRPEVERQVPTTIVELAMNDRVTILTHNAMGDPRFTAADSIWRLGIRAAACVPLWSGERVIGALYVDSPLWARSLNEREVDFLVAVANVAAVAVERIREHNARTRLQRYHAPAIVEEALRDETVMSAMQRLRRAEVTVIFADIVGFTTITETASPEQVAELLSGFCTRTAEAVFAEGGTLDKFIGDCVMAFFGAPIELASHAVQGVRTALRIIDAIERWNVERTALGMPKLEVRVGVNSGPVVVGELGNERRADYSVIGNTVNIAARLEETVAGPGEIVVGDRTRQLVGDTFDLEPLGDLELRGLEHRIAAHRLRRSVT